MDLLGLARQGSSGDPSAIDPANLRLRLRPDLGAMSLSGSDVASWTDVAGGHVFSDASNRPVYGATSGPNSRPSVAFTSGNSDRLKNTSFAQAWYALNATERDIPWTILMVIKSSNWANSQGFFYNGAATASSGTAISTLHIRSNSSNCQVTLHGGSAQTLFTPSSGVWNAILIQRTGGAGGSGQGSYWRDSAGSSGTWNTTQTDGVGTAAYWESYLGAQPNGSAGASPAFFASMDLAELVIWSSVLSSAQIASIRTNYIAPYYAL